MRFISVIIYTSLYCTNKYYFSLQRCFFKIKKPVCFIERARSSGSGSTMEAPGVRYVDGGNNSGILQWDNSGPHASNSNDGKRSEWVNFLRKGDKVQLIPISAEESLVEFIKYFDNLGQNECIRVYGVTTDGRPLGSDPSVVCEFRCDM